MTIRLMKRFLAADSRGLWFLHQGDEVCWLWPWKWKRGDPTRWLAVIGGGASFPSLAAKEQFWKDYFAELAKKQDVDLSMDSW